jgi:alpha-glucosidase
MFRTAIRVRREVCDLIDGGFEWAPAPINVLSYRRGDVTVLLNASGQDVDLPAGEVLVASGPLGNATVPPDTTVWLR